MSLKDTLQRFRDKYTKKVLQFYPDHSETHLILLNDIEQFITEEIKKAFDEVMPNFKDSDEHNSREFIDGYNDCHYDLRKNIENYFNN